MSRADYQAWVIENVNQETHGYGKCEEVVLKMAQSFPELKPRRGWFYCMSWGRRGHWWLLDPNGRIVDPTGKQHPTGSLFTEPENQERYEDLTDKTDKEMAEIVPTGVCAECGDPVYRGASFCNNSCEAATMNYMGLTRHPDGGWR